MYYAEKIFFCICKMHVSVIALLQYSDVNVNM